MASVAARAGANVCKPEASTTRVLSRLYTVLPCEHTCDTADRYLGSSVARVASACIFSRERTTDDGRSYRSRECSITRHCELIQTLSTRQDIDCERSWKISSGSHICIFGGKLSRKFYRYENEYLERFWIKKFKGR